MSTKADVWQGTLALMIFAAGIFRAISGLLATWWPVPKAALKGPMSVWKKG